MLKSKPLSLRFLLVVALFLTGSVLVLWGTSWWRHSAVETEGAGDGIASVEQVVPLNWNDHALSEEPAKSAARRQERKTKSLLETAKTAEKLTHQDTEQNSAAGKSKFASREFSAASRDPRRDLISSLINLPQALLVEVADLDEYLARLSNLASGGDMTELLPPNGDSFPERIHFSKDDTFEATGYSVFSPESGRIYATFTNVDFGSDHVIIRWQRYTGEVVNFRAYPIDPVRETNHVWIEQENWEPGYYTVWVLDPGDLSVLATGEYDVW